MKKICFILFMLVIGSTNAQTPVIKLKRDTVTLQSPPAQPVQIQPAGTLAKEEVWSVSAGNMVANPQRLELFTSNDFPQQLSVKFRPGFTGSKTVAWSSENPSVASVSDKGLVTGKTRGSTRILAITADRKDTAFCTVAVLIPNEWGNSRNAGYGWVGTQQGQIYFANPKDSYKLYKMDFRGQNLKKLSDNEPQNIQVMGRWIYFNGNDGIVQITIDGTQRKVIDSRAKLLRVHNSGNLYCIREDKVFTLNLNKPNQAMELVFEDKDPVFNLSLDQYYLYYNKYWENNYVNREEGGAFRYSWATKKKEEVVPVKHIIRKFAVEENSAILYYYQAGSNTTVARSIVGIEISSGSDPVSTGMYVTTFTNKQRTEIPQLADYTDWILINDWVYYFKGSELRRVKAKGEQDQGVAQFDFDFELYPFGEFLLVYSLTEAKIYRMLPDGRDIKQIF
jgi:hypothetical protein